MRFPFPSFNSSRILGGPQRALLTCVASAVCERFLTEFAFYKNRKEPPYLGRYGCRALPDFASVEPVQFLQLCFRADDWIAVFLKNYQNGRVVQRIGPLNWATSDHVQAWLYAMNARHFNVYCSVNAIAAGRRTRTRDAIKAIRHVFLEADHEGPAVLGRVLKRGDLPTPSYVLTSSPGRLHIFWRVTGFDTRLV